MKHKFKISLLLLVALGLSFWLILNNLFVAALVADTSVNSWSSPSIIATKLLGPATTSLNHPNLYPNVDCSQISYRRASDSSIELGCFYRTAYGLIDADSYMTIFNGSSEALPIIPYNPQELLVAWPGTADVLTLDSALNEGVYLGMYKNIYTSLKDQNGLLGEINGKKVSLAPEYRFHDSHGANLIINPQTITFSSNSSWLVAETVGGAFVRINLATLDVKPFAPAFSTISSSSLFDSHLAISSSGRYVAISNTVADSFKVYDLASCQTGTNYQLCPYFDYKSYVKSKISNLTSIKQVRFVNEELLSFVANTISGSNSYLLAPRSEITTLSNYLALGDSYTSGEGAFDYVDGTDTTVNHCHLSLHSYPLLISGQLFGNAGGHSVACSGARSQDILPSNPDTYSGQIIHASQTAKLSSLDISHLLSDYTPGNLPQSDFVSQYQPEVLTVSVGGNDIGFGNMLVNCVMPHWSRYTSDNVCYNSYEDRLEVIKLIDRTVPTWTNIFKQLQAKSPLSQIYAIGYPQIAYDKGQCALNVQLNKSELEFSAEIIAYLNGAIQQSAKLAAISYVDIADALYGYRLCENASYNTAVNGLTAGKDNGLFGLKILGRESYHPTAFGHYLIESTILRRTNNFRSPISPESIINSSQSLLNSPKSGRTVQTIIPATTILPEIVNPNTSYPIAIDGQTNGLRPATIYMIELDRLTSGQATTVITDSLGNITTTFVLPAANSGPHTVDILGTNQSGDSIDITQPIYVTAGSLDSDGDSLPDTTDSCPLARNSGIDSDNDGIDDICDAYIGPTSSTSGTTPVGSSPPATITTANDTTTSNIPINPMPSTNPEPLSSSSITGSLESPTSVTSKLRSPLSTRQITPIKTPSNNLNTASTIAPKPISSNKLIKNLIPPSVKHITMSSWLIYTVWISTYLVGLLLGLWVAYRIIAYARRRSHRNRPRQLAMG